MNFESPPSDLKQKLGLNCSFRNSVTWEFSALQDKPAVIWHWGWQRKVTKKYHWNIISFFYLQFELFLKHFLTVLSTELCTQRAVYNHDQTQSTLRGTMVQKSLQAELKSSFTKWHWLYFSAGYGSHSGKKMLHSGWVKNLTTQWEKNWCSQCTNTFL